MGTLALLALDALVFAVMFSGAPSNLLFPLALTFTTFALASGAWLWFRLARRSVVARGAFASMYSVAAAVFTAMWAASAMLGVGIALAAPCALTIVALSYVTVVQRDAHKEH